MSNTAAWIKEEKGPIVVDAADIPNPGPNELVVKNAAIGLNPVEAKTQKLAVFPLSYPTILGQSFAGIVEKVGSSVTTFKAGDHVAVKRSSALSNPPSAGAFQHHVLADSRTTAKLQDNTAFSAGAAAIVNLATAASALHLFLKLDHPAPPPDLNPANKAKKVLIYGGSSNTGGYAVQFACNAGYTVVTTSSPQHTAFVSSLGAGRVIDHTQPESSIISELKVEGPYDAVFDSIGLPPVTAIIGQVMKEKGGVFYSTLPPMGQVELPENVERRFESFPLALEKPENEGFREWYYGGLGPFLATGNDKMSAPEKMERVSGGLEGIQEGLDKLMKGVSGKKLIVEL